uniref:PIR Superfamily Protein n=1 Tax=Strongyloides papillosus TaxID=174720 RepID=A0A0N5CH73_STREA
MVLKNVTIFIEDNGNHKAKKSYPLENKVKNCDKQTNTVLCICLVNLICQLGVYFCLFRLEENSLLIGGIGLIITCLFIIIFYIGYYKKFKNYKYTNVAYIICQRSEIPSIM